MDFDANDLQEIMDIVNLASEPIKKILLGIANELLDPKWAEKSATRYATFYDTLKKKGLNDDFAKALTKLHMVNNKFVLADLPSLTNILSKREKKEVSK